MNAATRSPRTFSQVIVVGRLGARLERRVLPSGTVLTVFTLVVDRPPAARAGSARIDAIACHTHRQVVVRRLATFAPGDVVEAEGVLRRRFWRVGPGLGSATEVEVSRIRRARASMRP